MMNAADILKADAVKPKAESGIVTADKIMNDLIAKGDEVAASGLSYLVKSPGSFEDMLRRLRVPLIMATPCEAKPKFKEDGTQEWDYDSEEPRPHYLDVLSTYPDHAYVKCSDEDKIWKVPYVLDGTEIQCGEPEIATLQFSTEADFTAADTLDADATV